MWLYCSLYVFCQENVYQTFDVLNKCETSLSLSCILLLLELNFNYFKNFKLYQTLQLNIQLSYINTHLVKNSIFSTLLFIYSLLCVCIHMWVNEHMSVYACVISIQITMFCLTFMSVVWYICVLNSFKFYIDVTTIR